MTTDQRGLPGSDVDFEAINEQIYGSFNYNEGVELDPSSTALLIIDMQPAFTSSRVGMGKAFTHLLKIGPAYFDDRVRNFVLPNTGRLLDLFRRREMKVIYIVTWSETEDLSDMPGYQKRTIRKWEQVFGEQVYRKWNDGMQVYDQIAPQASELVIPKRTGSAFTSSILPIVLQNAGIRTLVTVGCNTNGCVFETVAVGKNMGYEFVLVSDGTACFAPFLQNEAEAWIGRHFGLVRTTDETLDMLGESEGPAL